MERITREVSESSSYYVTETCYVIPGELKLGNMVNGELKTSDSLPKLPWRLLEFFMRNPGVTLEYRDLLNELYPGEDQPNQTVNRVVNRIRNYFYDVGVSKDQLKAVIQTSNGVGYRFTPHKPLLTPLRMTTNALRGTGISENQLTEMIECMLYRGISGRMGREGVLALAKKGNELAALEMGELYYHGYVTRNHRSDFEKACEWYRKAGNHPTALWTLGYCIMNNYWPHVPADEIDYLAALNYFMKALEINTEACASAAALTSLGQLWEEGHYPREDFETTFKCKPKNIKRAVAYYEQADEHGYHYATNRLALYYEKKAPDERSSLARDAFLYIKRSVELVVDGYALNKLGQYYETGFGCPVNPDMACKCYLRSVEDVLEDDVTGWGLLNAGRTRAGRIKGQSESWYDLTRAFELFDAALHELPVRKHSKVLDEMLDILIFADLRETDESKLRRWRNETRIWTEHYLSSVGEDTRVGGDPKIERIRRKLADMLG